MASRSGGGKPVLLFSSAEMPATMTDSHQGADGQQAGSGDAGTADRYSTDEVFSRILRDADHEITASTRELFASGLAAGFAITVTFLLLATMTAQYDGDPVLSALLYPLGFVYIVVGSYQLYTENTLPPVALVLERIASVPALLRIWGIVLAGNVAGGVLGAFALANTNVLSPAAANAAFELAEKGAATPPVTLFSKAAFAGLIVAGVVWLDHAVRDSVSRVLLVYLAFLAIPVGGLYHSVVSATEMAYLVFNGQLALAEGLLDFVIPVLLGNTFGGVVLVTVVNFFQTTKHRRRAARGEAFENTLSVKETLLGSLVGRNYAPRSESDD